MSPSVLHNHMEDNEDRITILLCTANLGNAPPTQESWDNLVPQNGCMLGKPKYPLRESMTSIQHDNVPADKQFDLIVFGFQEATFNIEDMQPDFSSSALESSPEPTSRLSSTERSMESSEHGLKAKIKEKGKAVIKQTRSKLESLTLSRDNMSTRALKESYSCKVLRSLMTNRLPSYERIV